MGIQVTILGSNSAIPTANRNPTSQVVSVNHEYFLIDCGEGTQTQLRKYGIKFQRISRIFISHLHGDHYFGLIGLLNTMHLLTREKELHIHAPEGLQEIIDIQMKAANGSFRFPLHFHPISEKEPHLIFENKKLEVRAVPVNHRILCFGFVFQEKPHLPQIKKSAIQKHSLSIEEILEVKAGNDVLREDGETLLQSTLIEEAKPQLKYAFITDTKPAERYYDAIRNSDLLYHEATFMEELKKRAKDTYHSTAKQAGEIAKITACKKLIIGHFSTRYGDLVPLLEEARKEFKDTELALEGSVFEV